jgi:hypothetical protein
LQERHASQGNKQAQITRQQTTINISPYSTDLRGRTTFIVHSFRGEQQHEFLEILACIPRLSYSAFQAQKSRKVLGTFSGQRKSVQSVRTCTEFKGRTVINYGRSFQGVGQVFKAFALLGFSYSCSRDLARKTRIVRTAFNVVTVVQWYGFLVQKSRSKLQDCPDKFVKFLKMNML